MAEQGSAARNREVLERMRQIIRDRDFERLREVMHQEFEQVMPQSGEHVVGIDNFVAILENFPGLQGGLGVNDEVYIAGDEEHYIVTPTFNVVKVADRGDELTSYVKSVYPDGSVWYIVTFTTFKDGLVCKRVDFYAPLFDPPEWRSQWVKVE